MNIDLSDLVDLEFYCEGRPATRAEVRESVRTGLPLLQAEVMKMPGGIPALERQVLEFEALLK